jgi:hypothetical protein
MHGGRPITTNLLLPTSGRCNKAPTTSSNPFHEKHMDVWRKKPSTTHLVEGTHLHTENLISWRFWKILFLQELLQIPAKVTLMNVHID